MIKAERIVIITLFGLFFLNHKLLQTYLKRKWQGLFKTARLLFSFYRSFVFASICIDTVCLVFFFKYGLSVFKILFWFKLSTMAMIFYFFKDKKEFYYYFNQGLSRGLMWAVTLSFDFIVYIVSLIFLYKYR